MKTVEFPVTTATQAGVVKSWEHGAIEARCERKREVAAREILQQHLQVVKGPQGIAHITK